MQEPRDYHCCARAGVLGIAGVGSRGGGRIAKRADEIRPREPDSGRVSSADRSACENAGLPDYGILVVVCEDFRAETLKLEKRQGVGALSGAAASDGKVARSLIVDIAGSDC